MREPQATYRVQLHGGFGFEQAAELAPYLATLGVSHFYSSPYLQAARGSTHGYDVVDHSRVNEELGGEEGHRRFCAGAGQGRARPAPRRGAQPHGHPAPRTTGGGTCWRTDPPAATPATSTWTGIRPSRGCATPCCCPCWPTTTGACWRPASCASSAHGGGFVVRYQRATSGPLSPASVDGVLAAAAAAAGSDELAFLADALRPAAAPAVTDRRRRAAPAPRQGGHARAPRAPAAARTPRVGRRDRRASSSGSTPRPTPWTPLLRAAELSASPSGARRRGTSATAASSTSTRLVGLRVEDERVFEDTHGLVLRLAARRGDRRRCASTIPTACAIPPSISGACARRARRPGWWPRRSWRAGSGCRRSWPIAGTTGYDFLEPRHGGLFVDPAGEAPLSAFYTASRGERRLRGRRVYEKKHQVLREVLGSDLNRLTALFLEVCERHRRIRDYTRHELHDLLREVIACFPVYRTYVRAPQGPVSAHDATRYVNEAIEAAQRATPGPRPGACSTSSAACCARRRAGSARPSSSCASSRSPAPAMAKGVEDTAFYNFNRLVSLNEVGGDPGRFGVALEEFHRGRARRPGPAAAADCWPRPPTTPSAARTCGRASACSRRSRTAGRRPCGAGPR